MTTETKDLHPITLEDLRTLAAMRAAPTLSVFLPTEMAIAEPERNSLVLKALLGGLESDLEERQVHRRDIDQLLKPFHELLNDRGFWLHQGEGLALYRTKDDFLIYQVPVRIEQGAYVTDVPVLLPLAKALSGHTEFHILALSKNEIRLFHCSRHNVKELDLTMLDIPLSFDEAMRFDDFEKKSLQHRPMTAAPRPSRNTGQGADFGFHGHGGDEDHKRQILRYFQAVDPGVSKALEPSGTPLILAGVEYLHPLYKSASAYPHILERGVIGNPDELRPEELHAQAVPLFEEEAARDLASLEERYGDLAAHGRASSDLADVIAAAFNGRVEVLMVKEGAEEWGTYDPNERRLNVNGSARSAADVQLYDLAARQTLLTSGAVYVMENVPGGGSIAALFRY